MNKLLYLLLIAVCWSCSQDSETEKHQSKRDQVVDVRDKMKEFSTQDVLIGRISRTYLIDNYLIVTDYNSPDKLIHLFDKNTFEHTEAATGTPSHRPEPLRQELPAVRRRRNIPALRSLPHGSGVPARRMQGSRRLYRRNRPPADGRCARTGRIFLHAGRSPCNSLRQALRSGRLPLAADPRRSASKSPADADLPARPRRHLEPERLRIRSGKVRRHIGPLAGDRTDRALQPQATETGAFRQPADDSETGFPAHGG